MKRTTNHNKISLPGIYPAAGGRGIGGKTNTNNHNKIQQKVFGDDYETTTTAKPSIRPINIIMNELNGNNLALLLGSTVVLSQHQGVNRNIRGDMFRRLFFGSFLFAEKEMNKKMSDVQR